MTTYLAILCLVEAVMIVVLSHWYRRDTASLIETSKSSLIQLREAYDQLDAIERDIGTERFDRILDSVPPSEVQK